MYDITQAVANLTTAFTGVGTTVAVVLAGVLTGLSALLGLGFGVRSLTKHITGSGGFDPVANASANRRYADQLHNEEILAEGDRVGSLQSKYDRGF